MHELSLTELRATGAFTGAPVEKKIEWTIDGNTYDGIVYVRRLSYRSAIDDAAIISSGGDLAAARIAFCIVDRDGSPIFNISDVTGYYEDGRPVMDEDEDGTEVPRGALHESIATALYNAILEVNPLGKTRAEN